MFGIRKSAIVAFLTETNWDTPGGAKANLPQALKAIVDDDWKPLFTTLGDLAQDKAIISVDLLDRAIPSTTTSGGWDWKLQANAEARVEIDALDADELKDRGMQDVAGQTAVRYTVAAQFGAQITGSQQAGPAVFGVNLGATGNGQFDWFVSGKSGSTLGQSILNAISNGDFVSPTNLGDQMARAGQPGYWGTATRLTGTLSAGATLSANVAGTGWSWGLTGQREQIGFSIGVSGRASLKLNGTFQLRAVPESRGNGWGLRVTLERARRSEKGLGVELSAGVDFSALTRSAKDFLEARLPTGTKVDDLAGKLSDPGSAIRSAVLARLTTALGNGQALQVVKLALGDKGVSAQSLAATLAGEITGPITDKLDEAGAELIAGGQTVGARIKEWLARLLRLELGNLPQTLSTAIDSAVTDATSGLNTHIDDLTGKITGKSTDAARALLDGFGSIGEHVSEALSGVSAAITQNDALNAVQTGLDKYKKLRQRVLTALGDAQRAKLLAQVSFAVTQTESVESMFSALFVRSDAAAAHLYAGLWRGHLDELIDSVAAAQASSSVEDVSGWLLRSFERTKSASVSVTVLGYTFSQQRVSSTKLSVKSDTTGNIIAASGSALTEDETLNYWAARQASLGITAKLLSPGQPTSRASLEISGAFTVSGKVMKESFVRELQTSLGMNGSGGIRRLLETNATRVMDDKKFWSAVTFMLPLAMDDVEWAVFTSKSDDQIRRAVAEAAIECMNEAFRGDGAFDDPPMKYLLDFGRELNKFDVIGGLVTYLGALPASRRLDQSAILKLATLGFPDLKVSIETPLHRVARATLRLGHLVRSIADLASLSRSLRQTLTSTGKISERQMFDACKPILERMTTALEPIAVSSLTFTGLGEDVPWPLVTFANATAALVGRPRFIPVVTFAGAADRPIPLLPA